MTEHCKIAIAGVAGRMGQQLVQAARARGHLVSGGTEAPGSDRLGVDIGEIAGGTTLGQVATDSVRAAADGADVWVDFTIPAATLTVLETLPQCGVKAMVVGTTGFSDADEAAFVRASEQIAIVRAGNFSLGVNLMQALVRQAAARLGDGWDIEILETHHRRKVDAPSGTALMLGEAAADGRGARLEQLRAAPYDGPNAKRAPGEIGFAVRRMGDVIGDHEVAFGSDMEIFSLRHVALDRAVFANGAIAAAEWAVRQAPGLYTMDDVLSLSAP